MTLLGLDFDNTLVTYDQLFHIIAAEKGLINKDFPKSKLEIRNLLRRNNRDEEFTLLQAEVYGKRIVQAKPAYGMLEALLKIKNAGIPMVIVSHKTKRPYKGPKYDLHKAAMSWLEAHGFFREDSLGWTPSQVFFEESKEAKISRILSLGCTHYIDDLPEILELLPDTITKILYNPAGNIVPKKISNLHSWIELKIDA